ncbi:DUF6653 family protein [Actinocrispum wychmicini]|uniref:Uncharacterized protein n=1 Tax=Actinocrispum wychmicini TaxID=1213861 RepID=A0A4R2K7K6_9PSEU|nr:DUF6653 family protein [Actinocrispum wychmicini]TCO65929.1 hypothetical protein EV192_1011721 [Actinocrispum wychmicini]
MKDETWRRHANPWSVWTRFAAVPVFILSVWSRAWFGWWCLVPLALVIGWLVVNPGAFPPVDRPTSWSSRGIYGERMWLKDRKSLPHELKQVLRLLAVTGGAGFALLVWGLVALQPWPTIFGATLIVFGQLWRIDRYTRLYDARLDNTVAQ